MASQRGRGAKNAGLSVLLGCTLACWHLGRGMLACWHAGMLVDGQLAREGGKNAGLSVLLVSEFGYFT